MPNFNRMAARITEPAVGAWVWASGSQVCSGNTGTLTAKAMAKATKIQRAAVVDTAWSVARVTMSKVSGEPVSRWCSTARAIMPTSMNAEPNMVNRKNLVAA